MLNRKALRTRKVVRRSAPRRKVVKRKPRKVVRRKVVRRSSAWGKRLNGIYIAQQHGKTNECYSFRVAKRKCEAAKDCHAIATQSNVCRGKYRVTHGGPTKKFYRNWRPYRLHAYMLNRKALKPRKVVRRKRVVRKHKKKELSENTKRELSENTKRLSEKPKRLSKNTKNLF